MNKIPTIQQFADMKMQDLMILPTSELKVMVSTIGTRLNKRLTHLRGDRQASHIAYEEVMKSGGKFKTTKQVKQGNKILRQPMSRKELLFEAQRERQYIKSPTSTVSGARKYQKSLDVAALGSTRTQYARQKYQEYKKALRSDDPIEALRQMYDYYNKAKSNAKREKIDSTIERLLKQKNVKETSTYFKKAAVWAYNEAVSLRWDEFHKWREKNMEYYVAGSLDQETARKMVEGSLLKKNDDDVENYFDEKLGDYLVKKGPVFR